MQRHDDGAILEKKNYRVKESTIILGGIVHHFSILTFEYQRPASVSPPEQMVSGYLSSS
jgi:hypothetical protein